MATPELERQTHALYRFYNQAGDLLYVGLTNDPGRRWQRHSETQPWWHDVARIDIETHPTRQAVRTAERAAIEAERPKHNVRMNSGTRRSDDPRPRPFPPKPGHPFLAPGKVVALGLEDRTGVDGIRLCPVGLITESDDEWVTLALYSWATGTFGYGERTYRVASVNQFLIADEMTAGAKRRDGYSPDDTVYDMDPLGDFQTAWKAA
jgi:predicted GIY-YIG superfamily endonuclease